MSKLFSSLRNHRWFLLFLVCYFVCSLLFLTDFPFAHSDEPWLSGLTRQMLSEQSLSVTEPFFNAKPRSPHAIKSLFHLIQMPFLLAFGYRLFSFRLLSLLGGIACLWMVYRLGERLTKRREMGFLTAVLLALDVQFLYASHFARQEILILFCMLLVFRLLLSQHPRRYLLAGIVTGLSVGLHPNSFLVAVMGGAVCASIWLEQRKVSWRGPLCYGGVTALLAGGFVALSLSFNRGFFRDYWEYGAEFEVNSSLGSKLLETGPYFQRLYYGVSGTYYTPDIRPQLILFLLLLSSSILLLVFRFRPNISLLFPLAALLGIWLGMAVVGRFSQTYVIFFFPFCYLTAALLLARLSPKTGAFLLAALSLFIGIHSMGVVGPILSSQRGAYDRYLAEIATVVPPDGKTIGNLNAEYHFDNGALLDVRNLSYLREEGVSLEEYIQQNGVEYVILSDELAFLYQQRPVWNGIYGSLHYLEELEELLESWELIHQFTDNLYGIRVVRYQNGERDFGLRIYRNPGSPSQS